MKGVLLGFLWSCLALAYPMTPDPAMTCGHLCTDDDPNFEEYRYEEEIPYCRRNVSSSLKDRIYDNYGIPEEERHEYTIDHLIPLAIGGSNHITNLWSEHKEVKALRPKLEYQVYLALKNATMTQRETIIKVCQVKFHPQDRRVCIY